MHRIGQSSLYAMMMVGILLLPAGDAAAGNCVESKMAQEMGPVRVGEPVPSFAGFTMSGQQITRDDLLKPPRQLPPPDAIILSFFTSWCGPCKVGLPIIETVVANSASSANVKGLLVAVGERGGKVRKLVDELSLTLPVLEDSFTVVSQRLGVAEKVAAGAEPVPPKVPRTLVLDGLGVVRGIFLEECPEDFGAKLAALIEQSVEESRKARAP